MRSVLSSISLLTLSQLSSVLFGVINTGLLYRGLGVESYGLISLLTSVLIIGTFLTNSLSTSLIAEFGKRAEANRSLILQSGLVISALLGFLFVIIGLGFGDILLIWIDLPENLEIEARDAYHVLIINFGLLTCFFPFRALLVYEEKFDKLAFIDILRVIAKIFGTGVMFFAKSWSIVIYFEAMLIGNLFIGVLYIYWSRSSYMLVSNKDLVAITSIIKSVLGRVKWLLIGTGLYSLREQGLVILVNKYTGLQGNGEFAVARQIFQLARNLLNSVGTVFMPKVLKEDDQFKVFGWASKLNTILIYLFFVTAPLVIAYLDIVIVYWIGDVIEGLSHWLLLLSVNLVIGNFLRLLYPLFLKTIYLRYYELGINAISIMPFFILWIIGNVTDIEIIIQNYIWGDFLALILCSYLLNSFFEIKYKSLSRVLVGVISIYAYVEYEGLNLWIRVAIGVFAMVLILQRKLWRMF